MARNDPQINLRIPSELKDLLADAAKSSGRSLNAEVVLRLQQSFLRDKGGSIGKVVFQLDIHGDQDLKFSTVLDAYRYLHKVLGDEASLKYQAFINGKALIEVSEEVKAMPTLFHVVLAPDDDKNLKPMQ